MRKPKPKQVEMSIQDFMEQGFNKSQATSLAWSEFFEDQDAAYEARTGYWATGRTYDCYCFDCKKGNAFKSADSIRLFIIEHKDHKTKTMVVK